MKTIELTQGKSAQVDDADFESLSQFKWYARRKDGNWYAVRNSYSDGKGYSVFMHREVLSLQRGDEKIVDHANGNGLDNRRENLRLATHAENKRNSRPQNGRKFKGVTAYRHRFMAQIAFAGERVYLGLFDTPEQAAEAYNRAAMSHYGKYARLNKVSA